MKTVIPFDFATVVCDGCACREDSRTINDEILTDYESLMDWKLEDCDWERVEEGKDEKWYCPLCAKDPSHRSHPGEGRVIVETEPLYGLRCDHCGREWEDFTEGYTSFEDPSDTAMHAQEDDWMEIGGKWYCPDCWKTCAAMSSENDEVENWEAVFCSKCEFKHNCREAEPRAIPRPDRDECPSSCPYLKGPTHKGVMIPMRCEAPADAKCPRVEEWKNEGIAKQEADNAAALAKCPKKVSK